MNITRENIDDLNAVLKVKIEKTDYEDKVETVLKDYRKKATYKRIPSGNGSDRPDKKNVRQSCRD